MGSCQQTGIRPLSDLQEFAVIARPLRRPGPIPFAPFPPLADRPLERTFERALERPLMGTPRDPRDIRESRLRSRWMPASHTGHPLLQASRPDSAPRALSTPSPGKSSATTASTARTPRGGCHATYHGQGTLSVLSSITGHHYRFEGRGCTLTIDPRDRLVLGRLNELTIYSAPA